MPLTSFSPSILAPYGHRRRNRANLFHNILEGDIVYLYRLQEFVSRDWCKEIAKEKDGIKEEGESMGARRGRFPTQLRQSGLKTGGSTLEIGITRSIFRGGAADRIKIWGRDPTPLD
jgi:hypothetical protein